MSIPVKYWFSSGTLQRVYVFAYDVVLLGLIGAMTQIPAWLFYVLCAIGAGLAYWQWRVAAGEEKERTEDRQTLRLLAEQFSSKAGITVENLKAWPAAQLRTQVLDLTRRMRTFEAGYEQDKYGDVFRRRNNHASEELRRAQWHADSEALMRKSTEHRSAFAEQFLGEALAVREEMCRRLGVSKEAIEKEHVVALDHGMLAGPHPITEAANQLEGLARRLPA
jgi:hypothetical protein